MHGSGQMDGWTPMLGRLTPPGTGSSHAPHSQDGEIELRHQRNPDCVFDFVKPRAEGELTCEKPAFIYEVIETLLPQAVFSKDNASGDGLLELCVERASERSSDRGRDDGSGRMWAALSLTVRAATACVRRSHLRWARPTKCGRQGWTTVMHTQ